MKKKAKAQPAQPVEEESDDDDDDDDDEEDDELDEEVRPLLGALSPPFSAPLRKARVRALDGEQCRQGPS